MNWSEMEMGIESPFWKALSIRIQSDMDVCYRRMHQHIEKREFDEAHKLYTRAQALDWVKKLPSQIVQEYRSKELNETKPQTVEKGA